MRVDRRVPRMAVAGVAFAAGIAFATAAWAQGEWKAPAEAHALKNPTKKLDATALAETKRTVDANCTPCHGTNYKGDGPAAAALPTKPADWTSEKVQKQSDGEIFWKISNGRGAMPPWGSLPEKQRWEIVSFIRTLKK